MSNVKQIDSFEDMIMYFDVPFDKLVKNEAALLKYECELLLWANQVYDDARNGIDRSIQPPFASIFTDAKKRDIAQAQKEAGV